VIGAIENFDSIVALFPHPSQWPTLSKHILHRHLLPFHRSLRTSRAVTRFARPRISSVLIRSCSQVVRSQPQQPKARESAAVPGSLASLLFPPTLHCRRIQLCLYRPATLAIDFLVHAT